MHLSPPKNYNFEPHFFFFFLRENSMKDYQERIGFINCKCSSNTAKIASNIAKGYNVNKYK